MSDYAMKYIMLTGHRKSGTTLLHKLFDGHPELNVYPVDISLLYAFYPCWLSSCRSVDERKARITKVLKSSTQRFVGKSISYAINSFDPDDFIEIFWNHSNTSHLLKPSEIVTAVAEAYCDYAGLDKSKPFLFKETSQAINFQGMIDDGLDIDCVQIIRDPRDNYAAIKAGVAGYYSNMNEDEKESLASVLNRASLDLNLAGELSAEYNSQFSTIRFEDLATSPREELGELTERLGIDWNESLLRPTFLGQEFVGNNHHGKKFNGISAENMGKWSERISAFEAAVIEGWMYRSMDEWGYTQAYTKREQRKALEEFYAWYNCRYFYRDSFGVDEQ
jgi:hypothetical protein